MLSAAPPELVDAVRAGLGPDDDVRAAVRRAAPLLDPRVQEAVARRVDSEVRGLGVLDELLTDPTVQEVMVNAGREVWVDAGGRLRHVTTLLPGAVDVLVERILAPLGRRLDRLSPTVDARLPDGSRVCAAIAPVSPDGTTVSIRRFAVRSADLALFAGPPVTALLQQVVAERCNVLVSGATSSGKTTLLDCLARHVHVDERIVTIEDTAELRLTHPHVVRLEARAETAEGVPAIGLDHLLRTALRLRPDRLVVGEVRGGEAVTLVQAMGTGHDGSLATLHANDATDALRRLEVLVLQGAPAWPLDAVRHQIHASVDVVVHVARRADGSRRIVEVAEVGTVVGEMRPLARHDDVLADPQRGRRAG